MPILETERLRLIPASIASLQAEIEQPSRLGEVLNVHVPENWPPDLYDRHAIDFTMRHIAENPALTDWLLYYFVQTRRRVRGPGRRGARDPLRAAASDLGADMPRLIGG
jgi:hypothetical protein